MVEVDQKQVIADAIRQAIDESGMTRVQVADALDVSETTVINWVNGHRTPRISKFDDLAKLLGKTRGQLMGTESPKSNKFLKIPVYGDIPAGTPIEALEDVSEYVDIPRDMIRGGKRFIALRVKGDSMYPKYMEGDIVILQIQEDCESGDDCAVYVNGYDATLKSVFKREGGVELRPYNPLYPPKTYKDDFKILGKVVELRRKI